MLFVRYYDSTINKFGKGIDMNWNGNLTITDRYRNNFENSNMPHFCIYPNKFAPYGQSKWLQQTSGIIEKNIDSKIYLTFCSPIRTYLLK